MYGSQALGSWFWQNKEKTSSKEAFNAKSNIEVFHLLSILPKYHTYMQAANLINLLIAQVKRPCRRFLHMYFFASIVTLVSTNLLALLVCFELVNGV